jgi:hypothetical protein
MSISFIILGSRYAYTNTSKDRIKDTLAKA